MRTFDYTITDEIGLHARPAGILAKEVKKYKSKIVIRQGDKSAEVKKLMAVMKMGVKCGETVTIEIEGEDEESACEELKCFFENNV